MHLCPVGQRQPGHIYWYHSSHIQTRYPRPPLLSSPGKGKNMIQDVAYCTWPYNLCRRQGLIVVKMSMPSFCSSETECFFSVFRATDPMDNRMVIAVESLQCTVIWSPLLAMVDIAERMQASYTLLLVGEGYWFVKTSSNSNSNSKIFIASCLTISSVHNNSQWYNTSSTFDPTLVYDSEIISRKHRMSTLYLGLQFKSK